MKVLIRESCTAVGALLAHKTRDGGSWRWDDGRSVGIRKLIELFFGFNGIRRKLLSISNVQRHWSLMSSVNYQGSSPDRKLITITEKFTTAWKFFHCFTLILIFRISTSAAMARPPGNNFEKNRTAYLLVLSLELIALLSVCLITMARKIVNKWY